MFTTNNRVVSVNYRMFVALSAAYDITAQN